MEASVIGCVSVAVLVGEHVAGHHYVREYFKIRIRVRIKIRHTVMSCSQYTTICVYIWLNTLYSTFGTYCMCIGCIFGTTYTVACVKDNHSNLQRNEITTLPGTKL